MKKKRYIKEEKKKKYIKEEKMSKNRRRKKFLSRLANTIRKKEKRKKEKKRKTEKTKNEAFDASVQTLLSFQLSLITFLSKGTVVTYTINYFLIV